MRDPSAITIADANTTVTATAGSPVVVQLDEAQVGGYRWTAAPTAHGTPVRTSVYEAQGDPPAVGAPSLVTYTRSTTAATFGTFVLSFSESQPWGSGDAGASFTVTAVVASAGH